MVPSRENMLEAFKDAKGKPGSVGGPFVGGAGSSGGSGGSGASARERAPRGNPRPYVVAFAALALAFVLGVLVGRGTAPASAASEVQAAGGDTGVLEAGDTLAAADELGEDGGREETAPISSGSGGSAGAPGPAGGSALGDARNKYTIVAISVTPANENLAWMNCDHLRAQGLAAENPIKTPNGMLAVVVGAAPKESDLADTKARLQRLSGPNGKGRPYEKAYTYPIRKLTQKEGD